MRTDLDVTAATNRSEAVQAYIRHHMVDSHELPLVGNVFNLPSFVTAHGLMLVLALVALIVLFSRSRAKEGADPVPRGVANVLEAIVVFLRDQVAIPYLGEEDGRRMTPLFCSFFFFILAANLIGLVPGMATATANIGVTAALALVTLFFMIFGAIYRTGPAGFVKGFVPHGVPWPILIVLVPIEILGLFIKAMALSIRLFANELAGHIVVFSLLGLVLMFGAVALPAVFMAAAVYILEIGVSFLQAYIFTLLSAVFIGQRYHPEH